MADATFEDGGEQPIRLKAETPDDVPVISALLQDGIAQTSEISWLPKHRRFALLINRFRWEDREAAQAQGRPFERVQSMLVIESGLKVSASGINPADKELVMSLLALEFEPEEDGAGVLKLILAGDGEIAVAVECVDVTLRDVSRPYVARAEKAPHHPDE